MNVTSTISANVDEVGTVANRIVHATGFWQRLRGLLGKTSMQAGEGLLIEPCNSIHTIAMRFPIDVVFIDKNNVVTAIHSAVGVNQVRFGPRGTVKTLELGAHQIEKYSLKEKSQINFTKTGETER